MKKGNIIKFNAFITDIKPKQIFKILKDIKDEELLEAAAEHYILQKNMSSKEEDFVEAFHKIKKHNSIIEFLESNPTNFDDVINISNNRQYGVDWLVDICKDKLVALQEIKEISAEIIEKKKDKDVIRENSIISRSQTEYSKIEQANKNQLSNQK